MAKQVNIQELQERRQQIFEKEQENLMVRKVDNAYIVNNLGKASEYTVSKANGKITCSCKDYDRYKEYDIRCKHILAVKAYAQAQKQQPPVKPQETPEIQPVKEVNPVKADTVNEVNNTIYNKKESDIQMNSNNNQVNNNNNGGNNPITGNSKFNPEKFISKIKKTEKGNVVYKDYLEVKYRIHWFRIEHPDWTIQTEVMNIDPTAGHALVKATVLNSDGRILSTGHSLEYRKNFFDFVEKAETAAVGRALAMIGYGTLQCLDLEEGKMADAPVQKPYAPTQRPAPVLNLPSPTALPMTASGGNGNQKPYGKPGNGNGNGNNGNGKKYTAEEIGSMQKYIDRW